MLTHCIIHTQNIASGRPAPAPAVEPEAEPSEKKRDPLRREKAPARCSSTGDAHTPPGHASPAARLMPDGRRWPRPLESLVCRQMPSHTARRAPAPRPYIVPRGTLGVSKQRCRRLSTRASLHAAPARPVPQRLRHDHLLSQATVSGARALAWPCSVPPPRTWLVAQLRVPPPPSRGAEQQCIGRVVHGVWRATRHSLRIRLTETNTAAVR